jgi:hypothetical protein
MHLSKSSLSVVVVGLIVVLTTACGTGSAPTPAPTSTTIAIAKPTLIVQVTPSLTPIPASPTPLPSATARPNPSVTPTRTLTPTPNLKDTLMAAFAKALANLKTYRVEVPEENRYLAVQLPDRIMQEGIDSYVKIGGTVWRYNLRGQLQAGNAGSLPFLDRANLLWLRDQFAQSSQVVLLGPGTADGVPCIGYSANMSATKVIPSQTPGAPPAVTQVSQPIKIWFATTDGFPRKVEMGPPTSITMNFFDLNEPIEIVPPQ